MKRFIEEYPIFVGMIIGLVVFVAAALVIGCSPAKGGTYVAETDLYSFTDSVKGVVCYKLLQHEGISCVKVR